MQQLPLELFEEILLSIAYDYQNISLVSKYWRRAARWSLPLATRLKWSRKYAGVPDGETLSTQYMQFANNFAAYQPDYEKGEVDVFRYFYELEKPREELPTAQTMSVGFKDNPLFPAYSMGSVDITFDDMIATFEDTTLPKEIILILKVLKNYGHIAAAYIREDWSLCSLEKGRKKVHGAAYDVVIKETYPWQTGGDTACGSGGSELADEDTGLTVVSRAPKDINIREGKPQYWVYGIHIIYGTVRPHPFPRGAWRTDDSARFAGHSIGKAFRAGSVGAEEGHAKMVESATSRPLIEMVNPLIAELSRVIPLLGSAEWRKWREEGNTEEAAAAKALETTVSRPEPDVSQAQLLYQLMQYAQTQAHAQGPDDMNDNQETEQPSQSEQDSAGEPIVQQDGAGGQQSIDGTESMATEETGDDNDPVKEN